MNNMRISNFYIATQGARWPKITKQPTLSRNKTMTLRKMYTQTPKPNSLSTQKKEKRECNG